MKTAGRVLTMLKKLFPMNPGDYPEDRESYRFNYKGYYDFDRNEGGYEGFGKSAAASELIEYASATVINTSNSITRRAAIRVAGKITDILRHPPSALLVYNNGAQIVLNYVAMREYTKEREAAIREAVYDFGDAMQYCGAWLLCGASHMPAISDTYFPLAAKFIEIPNDYGKGGAECHVSKPLAALIRVSPLAD